jgi:pimeloyl-ACP methyl ester carboxylesterase
MARCRIHAVLATLIVVQANINWAAGQPAAAPPPPEAVTVTTQDGVQLRLTYFPCAAHKGSAQAKQATPVVLLHDFKSTRAVFEPLAQKFQTPVEGQPDRPLFAVVTADLRAHGESTKQVLAGGSEANLDAAKLRMEDLLAMATLDMEAVRSFLVDKNDTGELNLNKLCLVGSGMGASVAANWALRDWSAPPLAVGKQGQDVKAMVLVSPRWLYNGLSFQGPMKFALLKKNVAWMLMYGDKDTKIKADVQRIYKQLERLHPKSEKTQPQTVSTLVESPVKSTLQGDKLLAQGGAGIDQQIIDFFYENVAVTDQPWTSRRNRLP